jgi:hypothetical protein
MLVGMLISILVNGINLISWNKHLTVLASSGILSIHSSGGFMYIVHYWAKCSIVGEYLDHQKFDDYEMARKFARKHGERVMRIL